MNDRGVDHGAAVELQPALGQQGVDPIKDRATEIVAFKQATEFEQRRRRFYVNEGTRSSPRSICANSRNRALS